MMETMERMVSRVTRLTSLRLFRARSMISESLHTIPEPYKSHNVRIIPGNQDNESANCH